MPLSLSRSWSAVSLALALAGIVVAGYLSVAAFNTDALVCVVGDCGTVQESAYAKIAGVPIALLGLGMYLAVAGLVTLRWTRPELGEWATFGAFALVLTGTLYYAYLTYIEIWVLEAICQWCVISSLFTLGLLGTEGRLTYQLLTE
jgi:uncharacterized membrane protein